MTIVETTATVDQFGNVTVAVPPAFRESGRTINVTLKTADAPSRPISQEEWAALIDRTAGSMPYMVRPPQPPIAPAPEF